MQQEKLCGTDREINQCTPSNALKCINKSINVYSKQCTKMYKFVDVIYHSDVSSILLYSIRENWLINIFSFSSSFTIHTEECVFKCTSTTVAWLEETFA